jgi:hypothetical protein
VTRPHFASRRYRIGGYTQEHFGWQTARRVAGSTRTSGSRKTSGIAKRICNGCPIRATCLTETMRVEATGARQAVRRVRWAQRDERRKLARKQRTA